MAIDSLLTLENIPLRLSPRRQIYVDIIKANSRKAKRQLVGCVPRLEGRDPKAAVTASATDQQHV